MNPTSSPAMPLSTLILPVSIMAVAMSVLWKQMDEVTAAFFESTPQEQASWMALVFSLIFTSVFVFSHVQGSSSATSATHKKDYPLDEIAEATTEKAKFQALFPYLRDEILDELSTRNELPSEATDWIREMMDYNVPGGKLNRGTTVISVYQALLGRVLSPYETARAAVLGWSIEFLQAFFLVADDVMDASETRRGQPCWYKQKHVELIAINDSFLLEAFVFDILRQHFGHEEYYPDLVALMLDVIQKTECGQLLDLTSQRADGKIDLDRFTLERYQKIVKYKTAYYSFYLPVALGMIMSGIKDKAAFTTAEKICCLMGEYFQIQDDYLDCYGDPTVIGKIGTDIQDNKCSWLVVQALERCTRTQRLLLEKNYGQWDDGKVAKVKDLYATMDLEKVFQDYEESSYAEIQKELVKVTQMPRDVFVLFLNKIYKRSK